MSKALDYAANYKEHSLVLGPKIQSEIGTDGGCVIRSLDFHQFIRLTSDEAKQLGEWLTDMYGDNK